MTKAIILALLLSACSAPAEDAVGFPPFPTQAGAPSAGVAGGSEQAGTAATEGGGGAFADQGGAGAGGQAAPAGAPAGGAPTQGGASGGMPAQAGSPAQGGSAGQAAQGGHGGSDGAAGAPVANACEPPTSGPVTDCTGKCPGGLASSCSCTSMDGLGAAAGVYDKWVVIDTSSGHTCGSPVCDGSVYGFTVWKGECARFTAMPVSGRPPMFARNSVFGDPRCDAWATCLITKGAGSSSQPDRLSKTYVQPGDHVAWIHAEASSLNADGSCPLACP